MLLRTLLFSAVIITSASLQAQTPVFHYFQAEVAVDPSRYKHLIEEVQNVDPTATVGHSDDWTIVQVTSTSGLIESAYRSAIGAAGITLRAGTPDLTALGVNTTADPSSPPVFTVTDDPAMDLSRYQAAVDQWNLAHPEQPVDRAPLHQTR